MSGVPELLSPYPIKAKLSKHKSRLCLISGHLTASLADAILGQRNLNNPNKRQKVWVPVYNFTDKSLILSAGSPIASFSLVNVLNNPSFRYSVI